MPIEFVCKQRSPLLGSKQVENWTNADMAQLVEQLIRNEQAVGSSPTISSKTCVNTAFSQVFFFFRNAFQNQLATKNLTLFMEWDFVIFGVKYSKTIYWPFMNW